MTCPLCGTRRARRGCPALDKQICAVCCGTKRLVEIRCPADCPWLVSAREHPPAVVVRQHQRDVGAMVQLVRDFGERQRQLFFLVGAFLVQYQPAELQPIVDEDVADAATALAATFETASRGVIYEHRPASSAAARLAAALKPVLDEPAQRGGTSVERDTAFVLRRIAEAIAEAKPAAESPHAFLDLLRRVMTRPEAGGETTEAQSPAEPPSRLILP